MDKPLLSKKNVKENVVIGFILVLISLLAVMMSTVDPLSPNGRHWYDSSVFVYVAKVMANGGLPYRDAFDHKGPLLYFINLLGWKIGYNGIWYVEFLFMILSSWGIYLTSRLFAGKIRSLAVVLAVTGGLSKFFEGGNFTEEYALPIQIFALYIFLDYLYNNRTTSLRIAISGFLMGLVLMLRANMIPVWFVFCAFIFFRGLYRKTYKELLKFAGLFLAGLAAALLPFVIYFTVNRIWDDFIRFYWVLNLKYTKAVDQEVSSSFTETLFKFMVLPSVLVSLVLMIIKIFRGEKKEIRICDAVCLAYMFSALALISMGGRYYLHYAMVIMPMLIYPLAAFPFSYSKSEFKAAQKSMRSKAFAQLTSKILISVLLGFMLIVIPWYGIFKSLRDDIILHAEGFYNTYSYNYNDLIDYIDSNTSPDDKISVFGNAVHIYVSSDRFSASRYEYNTRRDVLPEIMDEYLDDLEANDVRMVISRGDIEDERMLGFLALHGFEKTKTFGEYVVYE